MNCGAKADSHWFQIHEHKTSTWNCPTAKTSYSGVLGYPACPPWAYLCRRADHPSWSHRGTARAPCRCHARSLGGGCTRHSTIPSSHTGNWGQNTAALVFVSQGTLVTQAGGEAEAFSIWLFWCQKAGFTRSGRNPLNKHFQSQAEVPLLPGCSWQKESCVGRGPHETALHKASLLRLTGMSHRGWGGGGSVCVWMCEHTHLFHHSQGPCTDSRGKGRSLSDNSQARLHKCSPLVTFS